MARISNERLNRYRALADKTLFDSTDPDKDKFYKRALAEGLEMVSNNFNTLGAYRTPHRKELSDVDIAIVGMPLDIGVPNPRPGTRQGPQAIRHWSLDRNMINHYTQVNPYELCSIIDWGDVECYDNGYSLDDGLNAIEKVYDQFAAKDIIPLGFGGEHTCTYPVLKALSKNGEQPLALIHLDAHADTACGFGGAKVSDASLFQVASCEGFIDPEKTIQIGLRGRGIPRADFSLESGMRVMLAEEAQQCGMQAVIEEIHHVIGDNLAYLTIDTDVFDCMCMPGTTLPEPFGFTGREVRDVIRGLDDINLAGADLVELSPQYDPTGMSACLAAGIGFEMLCLLAKVRAQTSDLVRPTRWNY